MDENKEKDIKITQDLRIMQAIVKEAIGQNPTGGVNIVNIGQIQITSNVKAEQDLPLEKDKRELLSYGKALIEDQNKVKFAQVSGPSELFNEVKKIARIEARSQAAQLLHFINEGVERYNASR